MVGGIVYWIPTSFPFLHLLVTQLSNDASFLHIEKVVGVGVKEIWDLVLGKTLS